MKIKILNLWILFYKLRPFLCILLKQSFTTKHLSTKKLYEMMFQIEEIEFSIERKLFEFQLCEERKTGGNA